MPNAHDSVAARARRAKKAVNVSLPGSLLEAARIQGINLSAVLEGALKEQLRRGRRAKWLQDNAKAIAAYNHDVQERGTFGDSLRQF